MRGCGTIRLYGSEEAAKAIFTRDLVDKGGFD